MFPIHSQPEFEQYFDLLPEINSQNEPGGDPIMFFLSL